MEKEVVKASDTPQIKKECYVVPDRLRKDPRLVKAIVSLPQNTFFCQYWKKFMADYDHEGKHYCILHLPLEVKKEKKLMKNLYEALEQCKGSINYNFVSVEKLEIDENTTNNFSHFLSFRGASINRLYIKNLKSITVLDLSYLNIGSSLNVINCRNLERIYIKHSDITGNLEFEGIEAEKVIIQNCHFHNGTNQLRLDYNNQSITICDSTIKNFTFNLNIIELVLNFSNCNIESLNLKNSKYYLPPRIFESEIKGCKELTLPSKKDFLLKKLISQYKPSKKAIKNPIWMDQYRNFREIYNLVKKKNMHIEQLDYSYLMNYCLEKNSDTPKFSRILSKLYRIFSNYGQSIVKPFSCLIIVWAISSLIFFLCGIDPANAMLMAINPINKQHILVLGQDQKQIFASSTYKIYELKEIVFFSTKLTEKILDPIFLTLLGFALYNFRKRLEV